jgi:hypothetical protein
MPRTGSATYSLIGATAPTWYDGSGSPGRLSGSVSVGFADPDGRVIVNFVVDMGSGRTYTITGSAYAGGTNFRGPRTFFPDPITVTGTAGTCSFGCSARLEGFFAGPNGERIGVAYQITDPQSQSVFPQSTINGTAAFEKI